MWFWEQIIYWLNLKWKWKLKYLPGTPVIVAQEDKAHFHLVRVYDSDGKEFAAFRINDMFKYKAKKVIACGMKCISCLKYVFKLADDFEYGCSPEDVVVKPGNELYRIGQWYFTHTKNDAI